MALGYWLVRQGMPYHQLEKSHRFFVHFSRHKGITITKREPELIISLIPILERIGFVTLWLYSLLRQSLKPDRVILWLSESNKPGGPLGATTFGTI